MTICPTPWKIAFESRDTALRDAKNAAKRVTVLRGQMRPYHCDCGGWHLTHMSAADRRRLKRRAA